MEEENMRKILIVFLVCGFQVKASDKNKKESIPELRYFEAVDVETEQTVYAYTHIPLSQRFRFSEHCPIENVASQELSEEKSMYRFSFKACPYKMFAFKTETTLFRIVSDPKYSHVALLDLKNALLEKKIPNKKFISEQVQKFKTPDGSQLIKLRKEAFETKHVAHNAAAILLARGEKIELVVEETKKLKERAHRFKRSAKQLRKKQKNWWLSFICCV